MKQIICDKCGKQLKVSMINIKQTLKKDKDFNDDVFDNLSEMLGYPKEEDIQEIEGSKIIINLPKYKENKEYDLCEKCTKEFLDNNINKWLKKSKKTI